MPRSPLVATDEMPGMGPYKGMGVLGFENVSNKHVAIHVDQMSTGIMNGDGRTSSDGRALSIQYIYNCPITKKSIFGEVMRLDSDRAMRVEVFAIAPNSGKEYMCIAIDLTKQS